MTGSVRRNRRGGRSGFIQVLPIRPQQHSGASIEWLGHATVLLELGGLTLLTDPVLRNRIGPLVRIAPLHTVEPVRSVDAVLLSHLHADHADLPSLRALGRAGAAVVAPRGARKWLTQHRVGGVLELPAGEEVKLGPLRIAATPATHDGRRRPLGPAADAIGYVIHGSRSIYFAGDTDLLPAMSALRGSVDVALLPVWGWGSRVGPGHLDPERAAIATAMIAPATAIPIHWGTFALRPPARRPAHPDWPAREFARLVERDAPGVEVRLLAPGQRTML